MSAKIHSSNPWLALITLLALTPTCGAQEPASDQPKPPKESSAASDAATEEAKPAEKPILTAIDVVRHADEAARKIKSVKYRVRNQRVDVPESLASVTEGTVVMTGWNGSEPEKFRFDVHSRTGPDVESTHMTIGSDGKDFWFINHRDKNAQIGPDLASLGIYRLAVRYFPVYEFILPDPFGDELRAPRVELAGVTEANDKPCYVINVTYRSRMQESFWYFSREDYLPRRVVRILEDPEAATLTRASDISDLEVNPSIDEESYAFQPPEDYTVVDKRGE